MHFETYQDAAGEWRWRAKAKNGKIIADSGEGYSSASNARRAIARFFTLRDETVARDGKIGIRSL